MQKLHKALFLDKDNTDNYKSHIQIKDGKVTICTGYAAMITDVNTVFGEDVFFEDDHYYIKGSEWAKLKFGKITSFSRTKSDGKFYLVSYIKNGAPSEQVELLKAKDLLRFEVDEFTKEEKEVNWKYPDVPGAIYAPDHDFSKFVSITLNAEILKNLCDIVDTKIINISFDPTADKTKGQKIVLNFTEPITAKNLLNFKSKQILMSAIVLNPIENIWPEI